jgi:CAAX prenyl protease-like protein
MDPQPDSATAPSQGSRRWLSVPEIPRALPFLLFVGLSSLQGKFFSGSEYWLYAVKTLLAGGMLWALRGYIKEMKWAFSWSGLGTGVGIAALWIGLEGLVPTLSELWDRAASAVTGTEPKPTTPDTPWNPLAFFADYPALGWTFLAIRVLGRSLVVPPLEEVFYRSFVYRSIAGAKFYEVPLGVWHTTAFIVTALVFGLAHPGQWLPAIVCGAAYQLLVIRKKRLGDSMLAHATTNLLISAYAIATGQWHFT